MIGNLQLMQDYSNPRALAIEMELQQSSAKLSKIAFPWSDCIITCYFDTTESH